MPDTTDLVSAVGTWVAVGLALIALVGIVAPVLVWKATLSERNRALNSLQESGAETFGYVGSGLWTGRKVRIFRAVRAPLLRREPVLPTTDAGKAESLEFAGAGGTQGRQPAAQPSESSADWVQFGSVVEGYGIDITKGDDFLLEGSHVWMPVHTSWLLLIGLLGRFGQWQDKGRLPSSIARGIASTQASVRAPGTVVVRGQRAARQQADRRRRRRFDVEPRRDGRWTADPWQRSDAPWEDYGDRRSTNGVTYRPLYGLTGTLHTPSTEGRGGAEDDEKDRVFFSRHKPGRMGDLGKDPVGIDWLFWMAVGCLPTAAGDALCLADVQDVPIIPETPSMPPSARTPRPPALGNVHFDDSGSDSSDYGAAPAPSRASRGGRERALAHGITPAMYVSQQPGDPAAATSLDPGRPRAFEFGRCDTRLDALSDLANIVRAEVNVQVLSLREVALATTEMDTITSDNDGTFIARSSNWLRLESGYSNPRFLRRSDGQATAAALLGLPLSPHGYLISCETSLCRNMLCEAATSLPQLLTRTMWSINDSFGHLDNAVKDNLKTAMMDFTQHTQPFVKQTRLYFEALFRLDAALEAAMKQTSAKEQIANLALGCVMITSPELRSLISQSARLLAQRFDGEIAVDLDAGLIKVPTVLNFLAEFPVDLDDVVPSDFDAAEKTGTVQVPLPRVMLACQRAALRSAMLDSALDSKPLFEAVARLEDVVYMA